MVYDPDYSQPLEGAPKVLAPLPGRVFILSSYNVLIMALKLKCFF